MEPDRFDDVRLAAGGVRGHAHQGGPVSGAIAHVRTGEPPIRRSRWSLTRAFAAARPCSPTQLYLVIQAPTWSLTRKVGAGRELWAGLFAAAVNSAARRADASSWGTAGGPRTVTTVSPTPILTPTPTIRPEAVPAVS